MNDGFFGFGALPQAVAAKIVADEVGLEYGIHGDFRLRCTVQPIFRHEDGHLTPIAVFGQTVPYLRNVPVAMSEFLAGVAAEDRGIVARVCTVLPLANVHNIGVDDVSLMFRHDASAGAGAVEDLRFMVERLGGEGFEPSRLICEVPSDDQALAAELKALGLHIALGVHGAGLPGIDVVKQMDADIVRFDRGSFERFCADVATARLLRPVVSELKAQGVLVLVEGIDSESQLETALAAGIDLLQGDLLEPAMLVGSLFEEQPRETSDFRHGDCVVIPLFG